MHLFRKSFVFAKEHSTHTKRVKTFNINLDNLTLKYYNIKNNDRPTLTPNGVGVLLFSIFVYLAEKAKKVLLFLVIAL